MKKNNKKSSTPKIKNDTKINEFINKVKKGDYSKGPINDSLRINNHYTINNNAASYIFGVK